MCLQVRRLGLRQETEAAVRAAKQEQDGSDSEPTAGAGWCWLVPPFPHPPCFGRAVLSLQSHCRQDDLAFLTCNMLPSLPPLLQACCGSNRAAQACL
jgi:hypothetical protein